MINEKNRSTIQATTWKKVRDRVAKVNPEFAAAVDSVSPNDSYELYSVKYPFGAMIFDAAVLNLPNNANQLVPLTHHTIPTKLKEQLSYRTIPMGIILSGGGEMHAAIKDRLIPLLVHLEGGLFGVWEAFDPPNSYLVKLSWNVSSGARSLFMLPKITETSGYQRLQKEFSGRIKPPSQLKDHWKVFKELTQSQSFPVPWDSEILFFSKKWFNQLQKENVWPTLQNYLYKTVWRQSMFWRFLITFNLIWQQFALIIKRDSIKWGSYQLETLKHLMMLVAGALPSFTPADNAEKLAPINALQEIFVNVYGLNYTPTIMVPYHFSIADKKSAYYSINEPTLIESVPKTREVLNVMEITKEIKALLEEFKQEIDADTLKMKNTPLHELISTVNFSFYHTMQDSSNQLKLSHHLPQDDPAFLSISKKYGERPFCGSSSFLRGLVTIGGNEHGAKRKK